jgi:hypothetical protein
MVNDGVVSSLEFPNFDFQRYESLLDTNRNENLLASWDARRYENHLDPIDTKTFWIFLPAQTTIGCPGYQVVGTAPPL